MGIVVVVVAWHCEIKRLKYTVVKVNHVVTFIILLVATILLPNSDIVEYVSGLKLNPRLVRSLVNFTSNYSTVS